jgi:hypothetical protein
MHPLQLCRNGNVTIEQPSRHRYDGLVLNLHVNLLISV